MTKVQAFDLGQHYNEMRGSLWASFLDEKGARIAVSWKADNRDIDRPSGFYRRLVINAENGEIRSDIEPSKPGTKVLVFRRSDGHYELRASQTEEMIRDASGVTLSCVAVGEGGQETYVDNDIIIDELLMPHWCGFRNDLFTYLKHADGYYVLFLGDVSGNKKEVYRSQSKILFNLCLMSEESGYASLVPDCNKFKANLVKVRVTK